MTSVRTTYNEARKKWHWPVPAALLEAFARCLPRPFRGPLLRRSLDMSKKAEDE